VKTQLAGLDLFSHIISLSSWIPRRTTYHGEVCTVDILSDPHREEGDLVVFGVCIGD